MENCHTKIERCTNVDVCMWVCVYARVCIYVYIYVYICVDTYVCVCMYACTCICIGTLEENYFHVQQALALVEDFEKIKERRESPFFFCFGNFLEPCSSCCIGE